MAPAVRLCCNLLSARRPRFVSHRVSTSWAFHSVSRTFSSLSPGLFVQSTCLVQHKLVDVTAGHVTFATGAQPASSELPEEDELLKELGDLGLDLDIDYMDDEDEFVAPSEQPTPEELEPDEDIQRKAAVLLELLNAGDDLENKIVSFKTEIDETLLAMLNDRIELGEELQKHSGDFVDNFNLEDMRLLYQALKREYDRITSSAALRLLDDVLDILGDDTDGEAYRLRQTEAAARMKTAFTGNLTEGIDIFTAATALAQGQAAASSQLFGRETVQIEDFITETVTLLETAGTQQQELNEKIKVAEEELARVRAENPDVLKAPQAKKWLKDYEQAKQVSMTRGVTLQQLQDLLYIARELRQQILFGSQ